MTAVYEIEWVIPFVDALIPKLDELALEFKSGQWNSHLDNDIVLEILVHDNITSEDTKLHIAIDDINRWSVARNNRQAEYLLDLALGDAIESTSIEPAVKKPPQEFYCDWDSSYDYSLSANDWSYLF